MAAAATTAGAGRRLNLKPSHVHVRLGQAPLGQIYRSDLEQGHN
jgi:sugar/nucleoside kinase (ribokinase family)